MTLSPIPVVKITPRGMRGPRGYVDDLQASEAARDAAQLAQTDAELARDAAQVAQADAETARDAASESATQSALNASQLAYIDFTTKANGTPPNQLDTGQVVDFLYDPTSRVPVMSGGRLVVDTPPVSGGLADYYQVNLNDPVHRVGMEWTQPSGADNGFGSVVLVAWASIFAGGTVPKTWCHIVFVPGTGSTGSAKWFVGDGAGNLLNVKSQSFVNPAANGVTRWRADAVLDLPAGKAYARLPDGSIMTLTNAEIAAFCTSVAVTPFTFADIGDCPVICAEHFAQSNANTAKFGGFTALWGETEESNAKPWKFKGAALVDHLKTADFLFGKTPVSVVAKSHAPSTQLSVATTTSSANVNSPNGVITFVAPSSGSTVIEVDSYYEFTGADTVFQRLIISGGITAPPARAAVLGVNGDKKSTRLVEVINGLTPGVSYTATLQHFAITGGLATLLAGGSGGGTRPPLAMKATPL